MKRREAIKNTGLVLGYSLSAGTIAAVMDGCKAPEETGWVPSAIGKDNIDLVAEVAETILPATNTPGAKDVLVHRFVDEAVAKSYGTNQRAHILAGIKNLGADLEKAGGGSFLKLSAEDRLNAVIKLEEVAEEYNTKFYAERAAKQAAENEGKEPERAGPMVQEEPTEFGHYYSDLKGLILSGYFTSEKIGTEVLAYDPIPGDFEPCLNMPADQKAWAL